uniref:Tyrosine kinase receptor Cad96Ca n=1 Tax=Ceratitis capitata TaxID=7213 RepID=W8B3V4_CERCA
MMMISQTRNFAVELIVVVLFLTTFNSSTTRSVVISPRNHSRVIADEKDIVHEKSISIEPIAATSQLLQKDNTTQNKTVNLKLKGEKETQTSRTPLNLEKEAATLVISTASTISDFLPVEYSSTTAYTEISENIESHENTSKELFGAAEDVEISTIFSTTFRPAWSSLSSNISAQERERRLMLVLAARRNALQKGSFSTRIVTTGRTATVPSVDSTSKTPTDRRSICLRNCTKNFTRRTTASCMRQCSNFSYSGHLINSNETSKTVMIVRKSSLTGRGTQTFDRENNEVLFTDESSHGLFVIVKEQNDTLNHIPAIKKSIKTRSRNNLLSPVTVAPSSMEDDNVQPYLYFGEKLPPIKPATLTITSVSHEQPMLLEVSSIQLDSTTPKSLISTSSLSAVERSRARYKYRDRGYVNSRRSPPHASAPKSWEPKSRLVLNSSTIASLTMEINDEQVEKEKIPVVSSTPIIVTKVGGNETLQSNYRSQLLLKQTKKSIETTTTFNTLVSYPTNVETSHSITTTPTLLKAMTIATTKLYHPRDNPTTIHAYSPASSTTTTMNITSKTTNLEKSFTSTTSKRLINSDTQNIEKMEPNLNIEVDHYNTTANSNSSAYPKTIIDEDIEKLRALGPSLTQEIINDENIVIFLNQTTPDTISIISTNSPTSILRTTEWTPELSSPNSNTEISYLPTETSSLNKDTKPSFVGVIETTPIKVNNEFNANESHVKSSYVVNKNEVTLDVRRVNIATIVLAGICIIPLCALILYLMRSYIFRHDIKNEEEFDVCVGDQQPISPIKKIDSKYQIKNDEGENGASRKGIQALHLQSNHNLPMVLSKVSSRDTNHNNHYDEQCSVTSDQEFDRSNIRLKSLLGEGNFGQVWKAEADDLSGHFGATRIVAVKTIRKCSGQVSLKEEAEVMRKLGSHQNVVTLLGASLEMEPHMLIMEYAMRGRLLSLLRAARNATNILPASVPGGRSLTPLSPRTLGGFALDIACGMEYIAEKRIVHRDLAARNVLLDHNGICKICDFGMSIDLDIQLKEPEKNTEHDKKKSKFDFGSRYIIKQWNNNFTVIPTSTKDTADKKPHIHGNGQCHDTINRRPPLPIRWMAPEALQYHIFTHETDVWAFGIVLWEIATLGSTPYANLSGREVIRRVPNGLRPDLPREGRNEFSNLMTRCWLKESHLRPSFTFVRQEISRSLQKWVDDHSTASDYMDVSGFSEDLEQGMVYFNHRISEFECEI